MNGHMNSQDNRCWTTENLCPVHEVPFCDVKPAVSYSLTARRFMGLLFNADTILQMGQ
jgi:hypothetical protein